MRASSASIDTVAASTVPSRPLFTGDTFRPAGVRPLPYGPQALNQGPSRQWNVWHASDDLRKARPAFGMARRGGAYGLRRPRPRDTHHQPAQFCSNVAAGVSARVVSQPQREQPAASAMEIYQERPDAQSSKGKAIEVDSPAGNIGHAGNVYSPRTKAVDDTEIEHRQRRGPARLGRVMQSVEHSIAKLQSPESSSPYRIFPRPSWKPATPGPSNSQASHLPSSPGIFVTPDAPRTITPAQSSPQGSSTKRKRAESTGVGPDSAAANLRKILLERTDRHEQAMEQARLEREQTRRELEDQRRRIEELEQRQAERQLLVEEQQQLRRQPEQEHEQLPQGHGRSDNDECQEERQLQEPDREEGRRRRREKKARLREKRRQTEALQPGESAAEQQQPGEQSVAEEESGVLDVPMSEAEHNAAPGSNGDEHQEAPPTPSKQARKLKRKVLRHPLSGHNPDLEFDDADRSQISAATAFLLRLSQVAILAKFSKFIRHKPFFDTDHSSFKTKGCWVIETAASCDLKMRLQDSGEIHNFAFARIAVRLWHNEESIYSLLVNKHCQKAIHICHVDRCMNPEHISVESSKEAGGRRKCKKRGRCSGHLTRHKDGTRQQRKDCIFP